MKSLKFNYKKYKVEIFYFPGKWMKKALQEKFQKRLISVATEKLGHKPNFSFFGDIDCLKNKIVTIISKNGEDCCFNAMSYIGKYKNRKIIHLGAVYSRHENKGLMQLLYFFSIIYFVFRNAFRKFYITSATHTPKIFGSVAEYFSDVYPNGDPNVSKSQFHLPVKEIFSKTYLNEWDSQEKPEIDEFFLIKRFRLQKDGSILYPDTEKTVPKHRKEKYNKFCIDNISYTNGDEILQIGMYGLKNIFYSSNILQKG